jgi:hypothetical protein
MAFQYLFIVLGRLRFADMITYFISIILIFSYWEARNIHKSVNYLSTV